MGNVRIGKIGGEEILERKERKVMGERKKITSLERKKKVLVINGSKRTFVLWPDVYETNLKFMLFVLRGFARVEKACVVELLQPLVVQALYILVQLS